MIDAHTRANNELQQTGYGTGVTLPAELDKSDRDDVQDLAGKQGEKFDRAYINAMVHAHQHMMERLDAAGNIDL